MMEGVGRHKRRASPPASTLVGYVFLVVSSVLNGPQLVGGSVVVRNFDLPEMKDAEAAFGPRVPGDGVTGALQVADPIDACGEALKNRHKGPWVALVERSLPSVDCDFLSKVRNAERAGAAATIVYDYGADGPLLHMGKRPGEKDVSIPAVFISLRAGRLLKTILSDAERKGDLILTILPSEDGDQTWPSLVACAFIACFAMLVVIATLFLLERRNPAFRLNSSGAPGANGGRSGGGSARQRLLTASEVARLPVTCFAENASHSDEDGTHETCAVCLEDYEDQEELRTLDCDHQFHKGCIDPWLITNRDFCPVCKHAVSPPDAPKPAFQRLRWWRWWREGSGHRREAVPESSEEAGPEPGELAARADAVGEGYTGTAAGVASRPDDAAVPRVGNEDSITVPLLPYDAGTDENEAGRRGDDEQGARDYGGGGDDRDGSARRGLWSWFIPRIGRSDNGRVARNDVEEGTAAPMASG